MKREQINAVNTPEWVRCNDDARSMYWRRKFIEQHGGKFVRNGRHWKWHEIAIKQEKNQAANQKPLYIITKPDGGQVTIDNLSKFCRENNLNKSTMYLVMNGKRNHHKHHKCSKIEE